jgi:light-regulated signal transduction histidine kinase (bacteriophytochrome)
MLGGHTLAAFEASFRAVAMPFAVLSISLCGIIVLGGWRQRRKVLLRREHTRLTQRVEFGQAPFDSGMIDVATELRAILHHFEGQAAQGFVEVVLAVQPELAVRVDPGAFRSVVSDLLDAAIAQATGGRILLAARRVGNRVQVSVSDDCANVDARLRQASLREAERLAALHGAIMQIDARESEGTTVYYRLPISEADSPGEVHSDSINPAAIWAPARRNRKTDSAVR